MNVRIFTDSASDITLEELRQYGVGLIPMPLSCGDETYIDDKTIPTETFWKMLLAGGVLKTSQPSPDTFLEAFAAARDAGDAVICILISSRLSGTYQCALAAKEMAEYEHIYIIDGQRAAASASEKLLVLLACQLRDEGRLSPAEIARELESFRGRVRLLACIDTLDYLVRGGRLSRAAAGIGSLMQIKPIITFSDDGEILVAEKTIGSRRAMKEMTAKVLASAVDPAYPAIPLFSHNDANCLEFLGRLRDGGFSAPLAPPVGIGATIGAYIGPGGYGLVFAEN